MRVRNRESRFSFFFVSLCSITASRSVITHRHRGDYSTISLPGDDQEEKKKERHTIKDFTDVVRKRGGKKIFSIEVERVL
jgi:hypothetical protein